MSVDLSEITSPLTGNDASSPPTSGSVTQSHTPLTDVKDQGKEALKDIIYGSIAGVIGKFVEYPFDTVKVRLQSQPDHLPLRYTGPLDCFRQSLRDDGFLRIYRGISAPLLGAAVETSCLFFTYRIAQDVLTSTLLDPSKPLSMPWLTFCGAASGAFTSLALTPIELVKCKMQVPHEPAVSRSARPGAWAIVRSIYTRQGILGFWNGQLGTLIRETGGSAAWFGSYEGVSLFFRELRPQKAGSDSLPIWQQMTAGATAGMAYNFIFYPADTIKSRMQTRDVAAQGRSGPGFLAVGRALWEQHGLKGMYRGCGITVARAAPSSAFIFSIYEGLRKNFG